MAMQPPPVAKVTGAPPQNPRMAAPAAGSPGVMPGQPMMPGAPPMPGMVPGAPAMPGMPGEAVLPTSFWQQPFVQDIMPWLSSLALHIGVIVIGLVTITTIVPKLKPLREIVVIPDAAMNDGPEGGIPHPGLGGDPNRDAAQDKYPDVPPNTDGWADKPSQNLNTTLMGGGAGDSDGPAVIGVMGRGLGKGVGGVGSGSGSGSGMGDGDGSGPLAPYGIPGGGGGIGPKSTFIGVSGNARHIVYVCDASGSMMSKFDELRAEINKSVSNLRATQSYNVIFFQDDAYHAVSEKALLVANPENKAKTVDFVEKTSAHGQTDPIVALKLAFAMVPKPQLIFLLTDGDFPDNKAVTDWIETANKDKKVKINTIAYVDRGEEYEKVLKEIATRNGGLFKYVSQNDLGKR